MNKKPDPVVTRRADLIKAFITQRDMGNIDDIPKCFGGLPQGNESAWAKGCKDCPLYLYSDACSDATEVCQKIYWYDKKFKLVKTINECKTCEGDGSLYTRQEARAMECPKCYGAGNITTYTMEEQK
jgi:hypothetical protein